MRTQRDTRIYSVLISFGISLEEQLAIHLITSAAESKCKLRKTNPNFGIINNINLFKMLPLVVPDWAEPFRGCPQSYR